MKHPILKKLIVPVRWIAAGTVLYLISQRIDWSHLGELILRMGWSWLPAALLMELGRILAGAAAVRQIMASLNFRPPIFKVLRVNLRSLFFGILSDWLGAALRWNGMSAHLGIPAAVGLTVIAIETYLVWIAGWFCNAAFYPFSAGVWKTRDEFFIYTGASVLFAGCLLAVAAVCKWLPRPAFLKNLLEPLDRARSGLWLPAAGWIFMQFVFAAVLLTILLKAAGFGIGWGAALWICGFGIIVQSLPGAIFGWSLRVGLLVFLVPRMGGTEEQGAAAGIFLTLISLTGVMAGFADFLITSIITGRNGWESRK